jgi:hypothetical protein
MGISDLLGSERRTRFLRAASPMIALHLPWIRTAQYLAHVYRTGTGGTEEPARARFAPLLGMKVALDEWMMALGSFAEIPACADGARICKEVSLAADLFEDQGWVHEPPSYHETPPPLSKPKIRSARVALTRYEHLRFDSGYEPHAG